jgi:YidC/Oxa1 family membrane protein insertase
MSSDKRLITFFLVTFLSILAIQYAMELAGLTPPPPKKPQAPVAQAKPAEPAKGEAAKPGPGAVAAGQPGEAPEKEKDKEDGKDKGDAAPEAKKPAVELADANELVIGSTRDAGPDGYRLEVQLDQKGAGVESVSSARYEAEFEEGKPRRRPLQILKPDRFAPLSLALTLVNPHNAPADPEAAAAAGIAVLGGTELPLDGIVWEVVRDQQGRAARPISKAVPPPKVAGAKVGPRTVEGQEVVFRTRVESLGLVITKTYRLFRGEDGFGLDLTFESPGHDRALVYKLLGPHGIPIEGEWYTGTFRDAVFGLVEGSGTKVVTLSAYDIAKKRGDPERFQTHPLKYAGIENQYFAALIGPVPHPKTQDDRWDAESAAVVLHEDPENRQKADIGVELTSRPVQVGPIAAVTHTYQVFAGPKTIETLAPFGAEDLAAYRKNNWIPFAPTFARWIITPLLDATYDVTRSVAAAFGGTRGNYGVAIILLTLLVRLAMFPLGRKQAIAAKKMQDLQPYLKEVQEKYKDDKEAQTKETWALYKRHGVNPLGGCLTALIQLPIFVGLWQTLNNSVLLRHAPFLYIKDLAAPDMLFKFPTELPFLGKYFNLLPFLVVGLMLVQTKLFAPPATTPEAEAQQKMMKYMMIFMGFMFYKVPSGLGIYFITSSLWQIGERLLLPKVTSVPAPAAPGGAGPDADKPPPGGGRGGNGTPAKPPGRFSRFWEKVLEEAQKNQTYRNLTEDKDRDRDREGRDRGKPRARPGRRR